MNLDESRIKEIAELKALILRARDIASAILQGETLRSSINRFLDDTEHFDTQP